MSSRHAPDYSAFKFAARTGGIAWFHRGVDEYLRGQVGASVLDLGCGTGELFLALVQQQPGLHVLGIDISPANIAAAQCQAADRGLDASVRFETADYSLLVLPPVDFILSDGVLHLIPASDQDLAAKLARDLKPGGLLISTMPYRSAWARVLFMQRKIWRLLPQSADRIAQAIARLLHPREDPVFLAERVAYLRVLPVRTVGSSWINAMRQAGFEQLDMRECPSPSVFKLPSKFTVWRRT